MNTMEFNKIFGALTAALLVYLLANFVSSSLYDVNAPEQLAYGLAIETEEAGDDAPAGEADMATLLASASVDDGAKVFRKCAACHKLEEGANGVGPHLWGVVGRPIQAVDGFNYSGALASQGDAWSFENLYAFLENPKGWAPGTSMGFAGLAKPEERASVIAYLNAEGGSNLPLPERRAAAEPETETETEQAAAPEAADETETASAEPEAAAEAEPEAAAGDDAEAVRAAENAAEAVASEVTESAEAPASAPELTFAQAFAAADPTYGEEVFRACSICHMLQEGAHGIGPSLANVVGRDIASAARYPYSEALTALEGAWTPEQLNVYLEDPAGMAPGVKMGFKGLKRQEDRAAVIAYLNTLTATPASVEVEAAAAEPAEAPAEQPAPEAAESAPAEAAPAEATSSDDPFVVAYNAATAADGGKVFRKCGACHKMEEGRNGVGPWLHGVVGRDIGGVDGFSYSDALAGKGGAWTFENLNAFLENPKDWAPGTKMGFAGLRKLEERAAVIRYLNEEGGTNLPIE